MAKSGMNKFIDLLRLTDPEDEFEDDLFDDDYDDDDDDDYDYPPKKTAKPKAVKQKQAKPNPKRQNASASYSETSYDEYEDDGYEAPKKAKAKPQRASNNKLVSINSRNNNRSSQLYVIKPQEFNEAQTVTDFLKEGRTIVINMEGIEVNAAQRIIDFIGGACYALDGSLQAVSSNIFIAAPHNMDVSGDLREEILNKSTLAPELGVY